MLSAKCKVRRDDLGLDAVVLRFTMIFVEVLTFPTIFKPISGSFLPDAGTLTWAGKLGRLGPIKALLCPP